MIVKKLIFKIYKQFLKLIKQGLKINKKFNRKRYGQVVSSSNNIVKIVINVKRCLVLFVILIVNMKINF